MVVVNCRVGLALIVLLGGTAAGQTTVSGTGTWAGSSVMEVNGVVEPSSTGAQLPQNWVNTHEGDPPNGIYDETVYLGMTSNGCPGNGGPCDYVGATGLQASMDDWASQTVNKSRHVIVTHGSDFQGSGTLSGQTSGVLLLKSKVVAGVPTTKFIVYESDTPLAADRLACAHGIQDNLPGATDVGYRNNRCDGTCVGGYRTGTGGACVGGSVNSAYNDVAKMWTITATSGVGAAVARGPLVGGFGASHIVLRDMQALHAPGSQAPPASTASAIYIDLGTGETSANNLASHLYIDRSYIHEDVPDTGPTASTNSAPNAIKFNCNSCGITNTYIDGILRPGGEGHTIVVTDSTGPMKIVHNWTEGSSSSLFVGGAAPSIPGSVSVTDLEVRRNRFSYPTSWLGLPGYGTGHGMVRKNGLEVKEGHRILLDGNIVENVDATGGQKGPLLVATVRSCSGGDCDNYAAEISDLTVTNGIFRHGCQGSQGDGRSGVAGSGDSVSEGGQRWKYDNNLWYDIQRTNPGCYGTGMDAGTNNGQKFSSGGSVWTGCTATRQPNGTDAMVDCAGSPENVVGQQRHNTRVGDLAQITGCADVTFNTGSTTEMGAAAIAPTDPLSLRVFYRPPVAPASGSTSGCTFTQYQGWPREVTVTHSTVVANYNGSQNAYPFASGSQASKPTFIQRFTLTDNIGIGNGWGTSGTGGLEGTVTQTTQFDPATLEVHHNVWPTRINTKYSDFARTGSVGVSPPLLSYFPANNHCTGAPDANCLGMAGNSSVTSFDYNLSDWHGYRLCQTGDPNPGCLGVASAFAGRASDGGDVGFDPAGIDAAQVATRYEGCMSNCGAVGPYDDNSSSVYVPVAELYPDLVFGNQVVGTASSGRAVSLENGGGVTLTISSIAISGTNAADFSKTTTCGATLPAYSECTITVRFTPAALGARTATLSVSDDAAGSPQSVDLSGSGVNSAPAVVFTPGSLMFGSQVIGTSGASRRVSLQNAGGSNLTISSVGLTGTNANNFSQSNNCPASLAAGVSCNIDVVFSPLSPSGSKTASISIADSATGSPHTVSLTGTATANNGPVTIYPASATMPGGVKMPLGCDVIGSGSCNYSLVSGSGTVSGGIYTAPASNTTAVVRATAGAYHADATIIVAGTLNTITGDCAGGSNYAHTGVILNQCHMIHPEPAGNITRNYYVGVPTNYVPGSSGLVLNLGNTGHPFAQSCSVTQAGNEQGGWGPFLYSVPTPPVYVCVEGSPISSSGGILWNHWGTGSLNWVPAGNVPTESDFIRQIIFATVRDLNLNPKKVFIVNDDNLVPTDEAAIVNSDIVAGAGVWLDPFLGQTDSNLVIQRGLVTGMRTPDPTVPISAIVLASPYTGGNAAFWTMCGTNLTAGMFYHPLTHDDIFAYYTRNSNISSFTCGSTGGSLVSCTSTTKFCTGNYDAAGLGTSTLLEVKLADGGKNGTGVAIWKIVGNKSKTTPYCSKDWNGNDTYCNTASGAYLDLRNTSCNWQTPCNHFVDSANMPNSSTGNDLKSLMWKFFLAHPKP